MIRPSRNRPVVRAMDVSQSSTRGEGSIAREAVEGAVEDASNTSSNRRTRRTETMDGDDDGRGVLKEVEVNRDDELRDEGATRSTATERALKEKLERTSLRALRALEEKDVVISRLRAEVSELTRLRERRGRRARGRADDEGEWSDEREHRALSHHRNDHRAAEMARELDEERAAVVGLRGQLREARSNVEALRQSHEHAKRFALSSEKHAEALVERLDRVLRARESSARAREEALADGERNLSKRLAELAMECARLREDADGWKFKATSCEHELNEIRLRLAGEFDLDDDDGFEELRGDESLTVARLRVALASTKIALHEALAGCERDGSRDDSRNVALEDFTQSASSIVSERAARDASKIRDAERRASEHATTARELRRVNESQAKELTRMENVLREQMSSNQLTIESAEITAENARREKEHFEKVVREREETLLVLRDTVAAMERGHASSGDEWLRSELTKAHERLGYLENENTSLAMDKETLTGELRQLRCGVKAAAERAEFHENAANSLKQREDILLAQLEWHSDECETYKTQALEVLRHVDDVESENVNLQMKIKSLERLLSVQMSHLSEESRSRFEELSREVRKNVESAVGDNAGSEFCRAIQVALRAKAVNDDASDWSAGAEMEHALLDAQRTISQLQCTASKYEAAFTTATRRLERTQHAKDSVTIAFDHTCSLLETARKTQVGVRCAAMNSLEKHLTSSQARNKRLTQMMIQNGSDADFNLHNLEEALSNREETISAMQTRIDELEVTANELLSTRESVAHAMKSISAARDDAQTEVQVEKSRLLEAQRTITKLQEQISELHGEIRAPTLEENVDSLKRLVEEQALAIAEASRELENRVAAESSARRELDDTLHELEETRDKLAEERERLNIFREETSTTTTSTPEALLVRGSTGYPEIVSKLSQRVSELQKAIEVRDDRISVLESSVGGITSTSSHNQDASGVVAEALEDSRAAAVVAAAARSDLEASKAEIHQLREEIRHREDASHESQSELERVFEQFSSKCARLGNEFEREITSLEAYGDVMTAKLLNLEADVAESKRKEDEWRSSSKLSDEERRAHVERCKRYRELIQRLRQEHDAERAKLLGFVNDSEAKIKALTKRVESSWAGESAELLAQANAKIEELETRLADAAGSEADQVDARDGELEACKARLQSIKEETRVEVEKRLTTRFRRELVRAQDEIETLRGWHTPCVALIDALRAMSVRSVRVCSAVIHACRTAQGKRTIAETLGDKDARKVASLVGLSREELAAVFSAQNVCTDGAVEDTATALSMLDSPSNVSAAIAWCESRVTQLQDAFAAESLNPVEEMWRPDVLEAVTSLVVRQSTEAEASLRGTNATLNEWFDQLSAEESHAV